MAGPIKQDFGQESTHSKKKLKPIPSGNVGLSKSAKSVLSMSIFEVENRQIFFAI